MNNDQTSLGSNPPTPPIEPPPQYMTTQNAGASKNKKKGGPFATTSVVMAVLGILPLFIFLVSVISQMDSRNCVSLGLYIFLLLGVIVHGIGVGLGITGFVKGSRVWGIIGIISNSIILFFVLIGGLMVSTR